VRSFVSRPSSLFAVARRFRDRLRESARVENGRVSRVARRARARVSRARPRRRDVADRAIVYETPYFMTHLTTRSIRV
jgi:hypothetical protein